MNLDALFPGPKVFMIIILLFAYVLYFNKIHDLLSLRKIIIAPKFVRPCWKSPKKEELTYCRIILGASVAHVTQIVSCFRMNALMVHERRVSY